jgi:hypothetical protein
MKKQLRVIAEVAGVSFLMYSIHWVVLCFDKDRTLIFDPRWFGIADGRGVSVMYVTAFGIAHHYGSWRRTQFAFFPTWLGYGIGSFITALIVGWFAGPVYHVSPVTYSCQSAWLIWLLATTFLLTVATMLGQRTRRAVPVDNNEGTVGSGKRSWKQQLQTLAEIAAMAAVVAPLAGLLTLGAVLMVASIGFGFDPSHGHIRWPVEFAIACIPAIAAGFFYGLLRGADLRFLTALAGWWLGCLAVVYLLFTFLFHAARSHSSEADIVGWFLFVLLPALATMWGQHMRMRWAEPQRLKSRATEAQSRPSPTGIDRTI